MADQSGRTDERERQQRYLQSLVDSPVEAPEVEYKSSAPFASGEDFTYDLVRHILGMANSGGGEIIVGFSEDAARKHVPDPDMTDAIAATYDATPLSQHVAKFVRGAAGPSLTVSKKTRDGRTYPIISVAGFDTMPFFCRSTVPDKARKKKLLEDGALYVRDAKTRTVRAARPEHWEALISLCVRRRQSETIDAVRDVLERIRTGTTAPFETSGYIEEFRKIAERARATAEVYRDSNGVQRGFWEFWHAPTSPVGKIGLPELRDAVRRAELPRTGLPMGLARIGRDEAKPTEDGVSLSYTLRGKKLVEHWFLHRGGGFYLARSYGEDRGPFQNSPPGRVVGWTTRIWRIAEAVEHCVALYRELDVPADQMIHFEITHLDLKGRPLICTDPRREPLDPRHTDLDRLRSTWNGTLTELQADMYAVVRRITSELFEQYEFFRIGEAGFKAVYDDYVSSRAR